MRPNIRVNFTKAPEHEQSVQMWCGCVPFHLSGGMATRWLAVVESAVVWVFKFLYNVEMSPVFQVLCWKCTKSSILRTTSCFVCRRYAHFLLCDVITTQYHRPIIQGFVIVRRVLDELCNSWSVSWSSFAVRLEVSVAVNGFPEVMEWWNKAAIRLVQLPYSLISWCDTNLSGARYSSCMYVDVGPSSFSMGVCKIVVFHASDVNYDVKLKTM